MKLSALLFAILTCLAGFTSHVASARAEADTPIPPSLTTPDSVETSLGTLKFRDGIPDTATTAKVYDELDLQRGVSAFLNGLRGVSIYAARKGFRDAGVKDNEGVLIFSGLMDSRSLFLTANADTIYFISTIDLSKGPMVVETPPDTLGLFDDLWFRWVIDFGAPGPDRGLGGKYLLLPPGYDGPLPDGGYFIGRPTTNSVALLGRAFLVNNDPKPAVEVIKNTLKIYPYVPGSYGTSIGTFVTGKGRGEPFDGAKTYKVTLPPNIPAAKFWSFTLYDNQTRSMLQTAQRFPRAGSQSFPSPAAEANADGSTTVYFGPKKPDGVKDGNFILTLPGKGWFVILRLYSPLEPFFDKTWRPSEIEKVTG